MSSLWPSVSVAPFRTMAEMLYSASGDLAKIANNKLGCCVDAVGVAESPAGPATMIRYNCCVRVSNSGNVPFFQATTLPASPFDAEIGNPEGERSTSIKQG